MISLIEDNKEFGYKIYRSETITNHSQRMIKRLNEAHWVLMQKFGKLNINSTWLYQNYNVFSLVGASEDFYNLYNELHEIIKTTYASNNQYLWFQSWLNLHSQNEVLNWHNHSWYAHGYICIDPKNTQTVFRDYTIKNELGNIYVGPGYREHKVEVLENFEGKRITLGFDIENTQEVRSGGMLSMFPVI